MHIQVCRATDSSEIRSILKNLKAMFGKLFDYVETEEEFNDSVNHIKKYMNDNKNLLNLHHIIFIENILTKINGVQQYISHHKFKDVTTIGFQGDSIAESSFSKAKNKHSGVSTSMTIDKSGRKLIEFSGRENRSLEMKNSLQVTREILWSRSVSKSLLTDYAEGIFIHNFDRGTTNYVVAPINSHLWYVLHKESAHSSKLPESSPRYYLRVRIVTMSRNNFLMCSCGYCHQYLIPCKHICAVVKDVNHFTQKSFHMRWWKHFNYYYGKKYGESHAPKTVELMKTYFKDMKLNNFDSNGNYLGINMNGSSFLDRDSSKDIDMYTCEDHDMYINFMKFILDKSLTGPVITGSYSLSDFMTKNDSVPEYDTQEDIDTDNVYSFQEEVTFNLTGESISQLSQSRCDVDDSNDIDITRHGNAYNQLYPVFDRLLQNIKTQDQINESIGRFEELAAQFASANETTTVVGNDGSSSSTNIHLLNECNTTSRSVKRTKFRHER